MRTYKTRSGAVLEFEGDVFRREVSPLHQGYLTWLAEGNMPEELPPLPGPSLAEVKEAAKARCDAACQAYIFREYPQTKQNNIGLHVSLRANAAIVAAAPPPDFTSFYTNQDAVNMALFINEARTACHVARDAVDACESAEALAVLMEQLAAQYAEDVPTGA